MDQWLEDRKQEIRHRKQVIDRAAAAGIICKPRGGYGYTASIEIETAQLEKILDQLHVFPCQNTLRVVPK